MDLSVICYYGEQVSKCGYCKGTQCSVAYGMHAYQMSPQDYQDLIDRGWRRSGHYCYKPENRSTCCPCYTIRCDANEFKLSKSHKKILKRMNRFLRDGKKDKNEGEGRGTKSEENQRTSDEEACGSSGGGIREEPHEPNLPRPKLDLEALAAAHVEEKTSIKTDHKAASAMAMQVEETKPASDASISSKKSFDGVHPPCKKAKQIRLERRQAKLAARGLSETKASKVKTPPEKTLKDYINESSPSDKHKLKTMIINVRSRQFEKTLPHTYALYQKYQTRIHHDPPENVREYLEFLQRSPLKHCKPADGPSYGYGSFHQQYWLDDQLIAVGVLDILPHCVSSVYFFYDPDYSFLTLGTYGTLREIAFVQELAEKNPALKYYYMGFYIHSCPKMRYKGKLIPSYLLCPEVYSWHLLTDEMRLKFDSFKYQRLNSDLVAVDVNEFREDHLDFVRLLCDHNTCITYRQYIQITGDDDRESILEYCRLVGRVCALRILYLKL